MSPMLIAAVVTILLAAVIYTIAVFAEFRSRDLKRWHLALFWTGLAFDTLSTTLMSRLAGGFEWNIHGILGVLAIVIMLTHAVWATGVLLYGRDRLRQDSTVSVCLCGSSGWPRSSQASVSRFPR